MATWAKGFDFKNSANTARVGGVGVYGTDTVAQKIYLGLGTEPWNSVGLELTSSAITFKGNKIYHAGDKPTLSDIGAAAASHTHNYAGSSSVGGAANSAIKLSTARTLTIGNTGKTFNGSANVSWTLAEIGAAASSHSHNYLPLSGGTITGTITSSLTSATHLAANKGTAIINSTAAGTGYTMLAKMNSTNGVWTFGGWGDKFNLFYTANTTITAGTNSYTKMVTLLNESGNTSFPGTVTAATFSGAFSGNATTATTLATARTINGTSFNGSANITTANWGTARTITIGSTGKSVNGSANISWTLTEIGAASTSHTHNYAGSSSAGGAATTALACTGNSATATTLATARTINGTSFNGSANITTANWGTARTITIGNTGKSVNGSANVSWSLSEIGAAASSHSHSNYVSTSDYALTTISKTLTIGTSWMDTGIAGSNLATGSYIVQVSGMDSTATGFYSEIWTGTMSWYSGTTNSTDSDEIVLHKAGHASNGKTIYLRTIRVSSNGTLKLQIAASAALSSTNVTFKFRRLI